MTQGMTPVLDTKMAAKLKKERNGHEKEPRCYSRGCPGTGVFFLRRVTRGGKVRQGLYCDEHDKVYGRDNLKKQGGKVVIMADEDGPFEGLVT